MNPRTTEADDSKRQVDVKGQARTPHTSLHKIFRGSSKVRVGTLIAAALAAILGFGVSVQVRQTERSGLSNLSQPDLVSLLARVNDQSARLGTELEDLQTTQQNLAKGGDSAAIADAQKRLDQMSVLNGTVAVSGPGIAIDVNNAKSGVTAANLLDAVEELRDAGAESIQVGDHRVVASTWFSDVGNKVSVEGQPLPSTFTITALGDSHTMATAMAIPGGVTDTLSQAEAGVKVSEQKSLTISSVASHR